MTHNTAYNLKSLFEKSFRKHHDRQAIDAPSGTLTYGELDERTNALASALVDVGIEPEDRVAILMSNRLEYVITDIAIIKAGAAKVPINDMLAEADIRHILSDSEATAAICDEGFIDITAEQYRELDFLETAVAVADEHDDVPEGFERFNALLEANTATDSPDLTPDPDAVAAQFYTGGTTGKSKGVVHTHHSLSMNAYSHVIEFDIRGGDTLLLMTPLPHSAGLALWGALLSGAMAVVKAGFDPETTLKTIESEGITWTFLVPTMIYRVLDHPNCETTDMSSLATIVYGAAPMTPARLKEGLEAFGPVFLQLYGQTEVPNLITTFSKDEHWIAIESNNEHRLESAGQPCLMVDIEILDHNSGERLPPGEVGEIIATAPYTMQKYYDRPDATAETLQDGWVHTGDIGRVDEDGYLYLLDRENDVIITGGMNVYSTNVEDALEGHANVLEAAVIGIPHEDWGEAVHAVVRVANNASLTEDDLIAYVKGELSDYKVPKSIAFVDEIPTTPYGKHDKVVLRDQFWENEGRDIA